MRSLYRLASFAFLLLLPEPLRARADSPSADEFPYWRVSVKWNPQTPTKICSPDIATPHGSATWDVTFTSCVYTLAYFDTCEEEQCMLAFSESANQAPNCSYDGKDGTAQEVESYRLQRCTAARQVMGKRYVPGPTPTASKCSSEKLAAWDAAYSDATDYSGCFRLLVTTQGVRTCTDDCQRIFHDAVNDADECLFSPQAGALTQHEWLKHLLVWCIDIRGDSLESDPLLKLRTTRPPAPSNPKPTQPTTPPVSSLSSSLSSSGSSAGQASQSGSKSSNGSESASTSGSIGSNVNEDSSGSGLPIDFAASGGEGPVPIVSPPNPGSPNYGTGSDAPLRQAWVGVALAVGVLHML